MRVLLKELAEKLAVDHPLGPYENCPWSSFDDEKGISCTAEVSMDGDEKELTADIQLMRDNPEPNEKAMEQIFWLQARPAIGGKWDIKIVKIKGENLVDPPYGWEEKSCNFFSACVQEIKMGKIPDFDALLEREMKDTSKFAGKSGRGGKGFKARHNPATGMKMKGGM